MNNKNSRRDRFLINDTSASVYATFPALAWQEHRCINKLSGTKELAYGCQRLNQESEEKSKA